MQRCFFLSMLALVVAAAPPPNTTSRLLRIPVWVQAEQPATLNPRELTATLAGTTSRVLQVKGPQDDLILILVLDLVDDLALASEAKHALRAEIEKLPASSYVAVLRAQDGMRVLVDPTPDREAAIAALEDVPVTGMAGLLDTLEPVERVADAILMKTDVRVAVLYVTDSDIRNYREDFTNPVINSSDSRDLSRKFPEVLIQGKIQKLEAGLLARQAPLFIVHLRYRSERLSEAYQNGLKQLAEVTGGSGAFCRSSAEVPEAISRAFQAISSHYSVTLALPEKVANSAHVRFEAEGNRSLSYRTRIVLKER
jgi:hypothetical protein